MRLLYIFALGLTLLAARPPVTTEWTVLVYMNADNDLTDYAGIDLNEMEKIGSSNAVNIVVQLDTLGNHGVRRYLISKDTGTQTISSPVLEHLPEQDSSQAETLMEFILYALENYPSKNYLLVLWSHGEGYLGGISYDATSKRWMTIKQLQDALTFMQDAYLPNGVNIYAADACLMQSLEVLYQLRKQARYFIGSANREKKTGWNYESVLRYLVNDPFQHAKHQYGGAGADSAYWLALAIPHLYLQHYQQYDTHATMNTVVGKELERKDYSAFLPSLKRLAAALRSYVAQNQFLHTLQVITAASQAYAYAPANRDAKTFLARLRMLVSPTLHKEIDAVLASLRSLVLRPLSERHPDQRIYYGKAFARQMAAGLTLWLPTSEEEFIATSPIFKDSELAHASGWYDLWKFVFTQD